MGGLNIYIDESSQSGHRFVALGGIWIERAHVASVERRLLALRGRHRLSGELKWRKLSPSRRLAYEAFVDAFFSLHEERIVDWHVMFLEAGRIDHAAYSGGDKELGFNKFLYQFLFHRIRQYPDARPVRIYLDSRTTRHDPDRSLRPILNNALRREFRTDSGPVAHVHFLDSKKSHLLQVNDIILGAMAYLRNDRHLGLRASAAKTAVAKDIMARAGLTGLSRNTPRGATFSVWNFRLASPKKAPRPYAIMALPFSGSSPCHGQGFRVAGSCSLAVVYGPRHRSVNRILRASSKMLKDGQSVGAFDAGGGVTI